MLASLTHGGGENVPAIPGVRNLKFNVSGKGPIAPVFVFLSVRDVVAGLDITIVRTDVDDIYYFGDYADQAYRNATQLIGTLFPRDLMAKHSNGPATYGTVSLGCDRGEIVVPTGNGVTVTEAFTTIDNGELAVRFKVSFNFIITFLWHNNPLVLQEHTSGIVVMGLWYHYHNIIMIPNFSEAVTFF